MQRRGGSLLGRTRESEGKISDDGPPKEAGSDATDPVLDPPYGPSVPNGPARFTLNPEWMAASTS